MSLNSQLVNRRCVQSIAVLWFGDNLDRKIGLIVECFVNYRNSLKTHISLLLNWKLSKTTGFFLKAISLALKLEKYWHALVQLCRFRLICQANGNSETIALTAFSTALICSLQMQVFPRCFETEEQKGSVRIFYQIRLLLWRACSDCKANTSVSSLQTRTFSYMWGHSSQRRRGQNKAFFNYLCSKSKALHFLAGWRAVKGCCCWVP